MQSEASPTEPIDTTKHIGLVHMVARRYVRLIQGTSLTYDDLVQEGRLALLHAAEKYDPAKGTFATYAVFWLRAGIGRFVADNVRTVRVPVYRNGQKTRHEHPIFAVRIERTQPGYDEPVNLLDAMHERFDDSETAEESAEAKGMKAVLAQAMLTRLDPRERIVIIGRFWQELGLREIGEKLGLTRERVRQIEAQAIQKLRVPVKMAGA